jgi:hypothetical protein
MYVSASVGGGTTRTPSIFKNIIVIEDSTTAIISVGLFEKELTQYNTIKIPILIYDSNNSGDSAIVTLWENGNLKDTWTNVKNLDNTRFWAYTPTVSGITTLIVKCNGVEKSFTITVKGLNINLNETAGYAFKFKANEFASNSNVLGWSSNGINATFSDNFDWINGGLKSETAEDGNSRQFVTVKAGSTMTINYSMFKETAKTLGKSFKIIFKATNCRDYDARLLSCKRDKKIISTSDVEKYIVIDNGETLSHSAVLNINDNSVVMVNAVSDIFDLTNKENRDKFNEQYVNYNDKVYLCKIKKVEGSDNVYYAVFFETYVEDTFEGFVMNAQNASFKSRNSTISTQYCEDSYIELELDIAKEDPSGIKNYITFWIDGVPSGFVIYDTSDSFIDSTN